MNDMESMRTFADQLWKYMVPKLDSKFASNVSYFRAQVKTNLGNNMLEVERPLEGGTLVLPCTNAMSGAVADQQVVALVMGSMSNAIVVGDGKLNTPSGGSGVSVTGFQAQPDGSLVITLSNGNTFTATPHDPTKQDLLTFDDAPTAGSSNPVKSSGIKTALDGKADNAFANVKVGSTTIAADSTADTLELAAGTNITLTPDATNDKVTVATTAEVNQNAFSNVKVGSTTVSADTKTDTLTLVAGSHVNLTASSSDDSVTIGVDMTHTHDASDIVSGILPAARGGTGNGNGLIQIGQKSGEAIGTGATSEGYRTIAGGQYSHAEGDRTTASGTDSHSEGFSTTSSGSHSHAEGYYAEASGNFGSHGEGYRTTASGDYGSHAEGHQTTASGAYGSHAEGTLTVASGAQGSHAEGHATIAAGESQHVFGVYNVSDTTNAEIVGWGTATTRKNIRTLGRTGNEWIAGTLTQASDARLKDVQGEIPDISNVRAVKFKWKEGHGDDGEHIGYLAQDVEGIAPYLVGEDSNGYKSLDYIALLVSKVEMLEREIERLKSNPSF